jgi:ankyrin repeat protein
MRLPKYSNILFTVLIFVLLTCSSYSQSIFDAVRKGNLQQVAELVEQEPGIVNELNNENTTALHLAASLGNDYIVKYLVDHGALINVKNNREQTPLHVAISATSPNEGVIQILIENGADINAKVNEDIPLTIAASMRMGNIVDLLIDKGADIPVNDNVGEKLLRLAVSRNLVRLFDIMKQKGANLNIKVKNEGSLIHLATESGNKEMVEKLIMEGLNVNQIDFAGWTPLHYAAYYNRNEIAVILVQGGADINAINIMGKSAYNLAKEENHTEVMEFLIDRNSDTRSSKFPELRGEYLGQLFHNKKSEVFAKGIVSGHQSVSSTIVFSPDNSEAYWANWIIYPDTKVRKTEIVFMNIENGLWTEPTRAPYSSDSDHAPIFSLSGEKLFFQSERPLEYEPKLKALRIWYMDRIGNKWSTPITLDTLINTMHLRRGFSFDKEGNLFFAASDDNSSGKGDIYFSKLINGKYSEPEKLGEHINTQDDEFWPCISPEGDFILFNRLSPGFDIYISFKDRNGSWTSAQSIGESVEKGEGIGHPALSPDGKYLFFVKYVEGIDRMYWINTKFIKELKTSILE